MAPEASRSNGVFTVYEELLHTSKSQKSMSLKSALQLWSREEKLCYSLLSRKNPKPTPLSLLQIQSFLLRRSLLFPNIQLFTLLITSLASSISHFTHAHRLFVLQANRDAFLCNSMLLSYTKHNMFRESVAFYRFLRRQCFHPNDYTFSYLLKSCAFCKREGIQGKWLALTKYLMKCIAKI